MSELESEMQEINALYIPKNKNIEVRLEGKTITPSETKSIIGQINKSLDTFNYPECLNRIVDVAVDRAEKEILRFKELDRVEEHHREMMSRMDFPDIYRDPHCSGGIIISGGGGGGGSAFNY